MKKVFVLLVMAGILSGCDGYEVEASNGEDYKVMCLEGVEYYRGYYKMAVKYNTDGNVSLCKGENDEL